MNTELKQLSLWLNLNRLSLNISKTNFIIFRSNKKKTLPYNVTLKMNKKAIMEKEHIKYLGVYIDYCLNWKEHISIISKKVSRGVGIVCKLKQYLCTKSITTIYYSLVYSHLVYGIQVWGSACDTDLKILSTLQNKAVRIMTNNNTFRTESCALVSADPLFVELKLLKIKEIFQLEVGKFIFSSLKKNTPPIFHDWFIPNHSVHGHATVSNTNIDCEHYFAIGTVTFTNTLHTQGSNLVTYGGRQLKVAGPILWNSLPLPMRESDTLQIFKLELKKFFLDQYQL